MADARMVPCTNCHAEVSSDREKCPHCGAKIVSENSQLTALNEANAKLRAQLAQQTADAKAENDALTAQLAAKK